MDSRAGLAIPDSLDQQVLEVPLAPLEELERLDSEDGSDPRASAAWKDHKVPLELLEVCKTRSL